MSIVDRSGSLIVPLCLVSALAPACGRISEPSSSSAPRPPVSATDTAGASPGAPRQTSEYAAARAKFRTRLVRKGPAPQPSQDAAPPPGAVEIAYTSGDLKLKAWVSSPPEPSRRSPALLFLHGGFAFDEGDWRATKPYRDAGFVVLAPMLRGENGLPGHYSMFFGEVDDVLAAADVLANLDYVQKDHVYVAGHSVGGTLAILAAMASNRFRAAASFSGSPDQVRWSAGQPEVVPFDPRDAAEFAIRSPLDHAGSFQCPTRLYHGDTEDFFAESTAKLAALAQSKGLDVRTDVVPGDHLSHVAAAIRRSIVFFRENGSTN